MINRKNRHNCKISSCTAICCLVTCFVIGFMLLAGCSDKQEPENKEIIQPNIQIEVENKAEANDSDTIIEIEDEDEIAGEVEIEFESEPELKSEAESDDEPQSEAEPDAEFVQKPSNIEDTFKAGDIIDKSLLDTGNIGPYFSVSDIVEGDEVYLRINGKSYVANDNISLSSLRYLKIPHYNFDGNIQMGEMIVNKDIADEVILIFKELFQIEYQIESMRLIDDYWTGDGDSSDTNSVEHNNTSAFCYRKMTGGKKLSNHAYGRAIDINPQQNPYVSYKSGVPVWDHANANDYIDRETGLPHVITHSDPAYELFRKYGFSWGGDWKSIKDYQHFEHE